MWRVVHERILAYNRMEEWRDEMTDAFGSLLSDVCGDEQVQGELADVAHAHTREDERVARPVAARCIVLEKLALHFVYYPMSSLKIDNNLNKIALLK